MPSREYRDPSGTYWEVFEVHRLNDRPNTVRPVLSSGWLAFVSAGEKRRLPRYPVDWMQLSDDELLELLRAASLAPDPLYPVPRPGEVLNHHPTAEPSSRHVERPQRPRLTTSVSRSSNSASSPPEPLALATTISTSPAAAGAGLPVPPPATVSGTLGAVGIATLVRDHARQARRNGVAVIEGMIAVKRALADAGEHVTPEALKQLRKVFVDEFYFSR